MKTETSSESAIPRQSLTSAVAEKLRDQIIRGEITEGAQLRQDVIAGHYHVSRIPVREALRQLHAVEPILHVAHVAAHMDLPKTVLDHAGCAQQHLVKRRVLA